MFQFRLILWHNLVDSHLLKNISGIVLQSANVDRPLFAGLQITSTHTQIAGGAHHATSQTQRIVREDGLGRTVIVFVGNTGDEALDIQLGGT